jgi:hypothetical protein
VEVHINMDCQGKEIRMNVLKRIKAFLIDILGPKKSIEQYLREIAEDIDKNGYPDTKFNQGAKLPVESLKLVWDKERDRKKK